MSKIIHASDFHLGFKYKNNTLGFEHSKDRRKELWESVELLFAYVKKNNIDFVLLTGDIYERELFTYGDFIKLNDIFKKCGANIIICPGNHDYYTDNSLYNIADKLENVYIFKSGAIDSFLFEDEKVAIYGMAWSEDNSDFHYDEIEKEEGYFNIFLLHADIINKGRYYFDIKRIKESDYDYIALGHIHKMSKIGEKIFYAGSLEPLDFGEEGEHGFILIDSDMKTADFVEFQKRKFVKAILNIDEKDNYDSIKEKIYSSAKNKKYFYRIKLRGKVDADIKINALLEDISKEYYHMEFESEIIEDYDIDSLENERELLIFNYFIEELDKMPIADNDKRDILNIALDAYYGRRSYYED